MQCDSCHAELETDGVVCPECGMPLPQNVEGFENTKKIQLELKKMLRNHGYIILSNTKRFIALLYDYIPEYEKERRLLKSVMTSDIFYDFVVAEDLDKAIENAKAVMMDDMFLSENAAEFVIACFTYVLGKVYESPLRDETADDADTAVKKPKKERSEPVNVNAKVYSSVDAIKHRISSNIVVPDDVTKLDNFCFGGFRFLRTIQLPESLVAIGEYAFSECKNLRGVELPSSLKIIKQGAFSQCLKLAVIKIPNGILEIEDSTFQFCKALEVVEIPPTVSSIGATAFAGCEKLRKLFLPESIKFIDANAFSYCPHLTIRCYENSYVHKYCLANGIKSDLVVKGASL